MGYSTDVGSGGGGGGVTDHGALTGLADDDHPQYGALAQDEAVTGTWTFSTGLQLPVDTWINDENGASRFFFASADTTYIKGHNGTDPIVFRNAGDVRVLAVTNLGGAGGGGLTFGSAADVNLYRRAANELQTDDVFIAGAGLRSDASSASTTGVGTEILYSEPDGYVQAFNRDVSAWKGIIVRGATASLFAINVGMFVNTDGKVYFGPQGTTDTDLYRLAADNLKTDDSFLAALDLRARHGDTTYESVFGYIGLSNQPGLIFGGGADPVNLYRHSANALKTDDEFLTNGPITIGHSLVGGASLFFGSGQDTRWYRGAANRMETDDALRLVGTGYFEQVAPAYTGFFTTVTSGDTVSRFASDTNGFLSWGSGAAAMDTDLFRSAPNQLMTHDEFRTLVTNLNSAAFTVQRNGNADASWFIEGSGKQFWSDGAGGAWDTDLYRFAADTLKTDDAFIAAGQIKQFTTKDVLDTDHAALDDVHHNQLDVANGYTGLVPNVINADPAYLIFDTAHFLVSDFGGGESYIESKVGVGDLADYDGGAFNDGEILVYHSSDSLWHAEAPAAPGGGGLTMTAFTKDLGVSRRSGTFDITGLSGLTANKVVLIQQTAAQIASKGNARDEPEMDHINVTGYVVDATTIRAYWDCKSVVVGTYAFAYAVSG